MNTGAVPTFAYQAVINVITYQIVKTTVMRLMDVSGSLLLSRGTRNNKMTGGSGPDGQ